MSTTRYYEEELYAPGEDGLADRNGEFIRVELMVSNFHGNDQIYLRIHESDDAYRTFHLTKVQAREMARGLESCDRTIAYDNTKPGYPNDD